MHSLIAVGELLVEFVSHQKGCELRELATYSGPYPSGAPAICIDQAARIGASTHLYGAVGADNFGNALINRLQSNGVETAGIASLADKSTGVAFVSYFDDGSRTFIFHLNNTAADTIQPKLIKLPTGPLIMHFSGSSLGNPNLRAAIQHTAIEVLKRGGQISCDPNIRPELMSDPDARTALITLVEQSSYLFPSDSDLDFLYPAISQSDAISDLLETGNTIIALTRGNQGSTLYTRGSDPLSLGGHAVDEVDPTGAGDCYCGTFLAMIATGHSMELSAQYANAAGAIAVTKHGPMEGNSNLDTIKAFIESNPTNTAT